MWYFQKDHISFSILYGNKIIKQTDNAVHLGVRQDANLKCKRKRTEDRKQRARNAFYLMSAQGMQPYGLCRMNLQIIMPNFLYGCECILIWNNVTVRDIQTVNRCHHFIVKKMQGLGCRTPSDMYKAMLG